MSKKLNTKQITSILGRCSLEILLPWVEQIKKMAVVKVLKEPKMELIMMRSRDTVASEVFNMGEVLVSSCTVTVDKQPGYGVIIGNQAELAKTLAIIDGAFRVKGESLEKLIAKLRAWLEEQDELQQKKRQEEFNLIQRSRVDFETMSEERKSKLDEDQD